MPFNNQNAPYFGKHIYFVLDTIETNKIMAEELTDKLNQFVDENTIVLRGNLDFLNHTNFLGIQSIQFFTTSAGEGLELGEYLREKGFWINLRQIIPVNTFLVNSAKEAINKIIDRRSRINEYRG